MGPRPGHRGSLGLEEDLPRLLLANSVQQGVDKQAAHHTGEQQLDVDEAHLHPFVETIVGSGEDRQENFGGQG